MDSIVVERQPAPWSDDDEKEAMAGGRTPIGALLRSATCPAFPPINSAVVGLEDLNEADGQLVVPRGAAGVLMRVETGAGTAIQRAAWERIIREEMARG